MTYSGTIAPPMTAQDARQLARARWLRKALLMPGTELIGGVTGVAYIIVAFAYVLVAFDAGPGASLSYVRAMCIGLLSVTALHFAIRFACTGRLDPFSADLLFVGGFLAFNASILLQVFFGLLPLSATLQLDAIQHGNKAMMLTAAALPAFLGGYCIRQALGVQTKRAGGRGLEPAVGERLWKVGFALFLLGIACRLTYIVFIVGLTSYFSRRYQTLGIQFTTGGTLYGISELLTLFGVLFTSLGFAVTKRKTAPRVLWPILVAFCIFLLVDGERGTVFTAVLALAAVRHLLVKPMKWSMILVLALAMMPVFVGVRMARNMRHRSLSQLVEIVAEGGEEPLVQDALTETGGCFANTCRTIRWVPRYSPHTYAVNMALYIPINAVPGLRRAMETLISPSISRHSLGGAKWLTNMEAGYGRQATVGLGFSNVAEAYWQFGPLGVLLLFPLVGFLVRHLEIRVYQAPSMLGVALLLIVMTQLFHSNRSGMDALVRPIFWGLAIVFFTSRMLVPRRQFQVAGAWA